MGDRAELLNDREEAMRLVLDGRQACIWTALPGIIQSVNFTNMTCSVQPTVQAPVHDEQGNTTYVNLPVLINVPLVFPSAGGFILTLPVAVNNEVLVVWASRCYDAWWQLGGIQKPMEARMHDLSDGFAIPGPRSVGRVPGGAISQTGAQLRNDAGTTYVEIAADGKIKLVTPSEVDITGNLVVSGTITGGGVGLTTHHHTGVTVGAGNTGGPVG